MTTSLLKRRRGGQLHRQNPPERRLRTVGEAMRWRMISSLRLCTGRPIWYPGIS
jgi:hypothetical protein